MTNTPKLWKDMTDAEKGTLLLASHRGEAIQYWNGASYHNMPEYSEWFGFQAYRIKPKAPKVETYEHRCHVWLCSDGSLICPKGHITGGGLANITHTYTITDGVVTGCDTIIHKNGEADQ